VYAPSMLGNKELTLARLKQCNQVVVRDNSQLTSHMSFGVLTGAKMWRISNNSLKRNLIVAGLAWGRLPEVDIRDDLKSGKLVEINLPEVKTSEFDVALQVHRHRAHGPVLSALIQYFK